MSEETKAYTAGNKGGTASAVPLKPSGMVFYVFEKNEGIHVRNEAGKLLRAAVVDHTLCLDLGNEDDWVIAQYLSLPENQVRHQAKRVKTLSSASDKMSLGDRLDELLGLSDRQLSALLPKGKAPKSKTRGNIIAALIQKEV